MTRSAPRLENSVVRGTMKPFLILVAVAVLIGAVLIALDVRKEWWSSLFVFALTFSFLRIYFLPSWWHAGLAMGLSAVAHTVMSGEVASSIGLAVMAGGLAIAAVCFYHVQRDYPLHVRKVN